MTKSLKFQGTALPSRPIYYAWFGSKITEMESVWEIMKYTARINSIALDSGGSASPVYFLYDKVLLGRTEVEQKNKVLEIEKKCKTSEGQNIIPMDIMSEEFSKQFPILFHNLKSIRYRERIWLNQNGIEDMKLPVTDAEIQAVTPKF